MSPSEALKDKIARLQAIMDELRLPPGADSSSLQLTLAALDLKEALKRVEDACNMIESYLEKGA